MKRISIMVLALMCTLIFSISICFAETDPPAWEDSALEDLSAAESSAPEETLEAADGFELCGPIDMGSAGNQIAPAYVAASSVSVGLSINGSTASCRIRLSAKKPANITSVKGTIKIINSKGDVVKSHQQNLRKSGTNFTLNKSFTLTKKGSYYMKTTLVCYKGSAKQETITKKTAVQVCQ